jgi:two-component system response regulator
MDKKIIFLIEDNPDDIKLTQRAFIKSMIADKIDLRIAEDGQSALDYLFHSDNRDTDGAQLPAVILLDLNLPKLNGLQVLERIRHEKKTKLIPVIVLTSSKEESDLTRAYKLGANSYIRKPVDFEKFKIAIQQLGLYWVELNEPPPSESISERSAL